MWLQGGAISIRPTCTTSHHVLPLPEVTEDVMVKGDQKPSVEGPLATWFVTDCCHNNHVNTKQNTYPVYATLARLMVTTTICLVIVYTPLFSARAVSQWWVECCRQPHHICQLCVIFSSYRKTALTGKVSSINVDYFFQNLPYSPFSSLHVCINRLKELKRRSTGVSRLINRFRVPLKERGADNPPKKLTISLINSLQNNLLWCNYGFSILPSLQALFHINTSEFESLRCPSLAVVS